MNSELRKPDLMFLAAIVGGGLLLILGTLGIAFIAIPPPRGLMFSLAATFVVGAEVVAVLLILNVYARRFSDYQPSGAANSIVFGLVCLYAVGGIVGLIVYAIIRHNVEEPPDGMFAAFLIGLTLLCFLAALAITAHDLRSQAEDKPTLESRRQHKDYSKLLDKSILNLSTLAVNDSSARQVLLSLSKSLDKSNTALKHSHGGGLRDTLSGTPALEQELITACVELNHGVTGLMENPGDSLIDELTKLKATATKLENNLASQNLL